MKNKSAQELGSLGGNETLKKHGIEHYKRMAQISVERRNKKKLEEAQKEVKVD